MSIKIALVFLLGALYASNSLATQPEYKIVTASEQGTYIQIAKDLAQYVAPGAGIRLTVLPSNGSVENVKRLRDEQGTKLALVQSDVFQAFTDLATAGNAEAARMIRPLRVIMPLYDTEMYFIVRADSPLNFIHDIHDKKINIGPIGSGAAMSATTLYRLMFNTPLPAPNASTMGNEEALLKLVKDRDLDVVMVAAGQPAPLFLGMEPGVEKYFKLLKLDPSAPASANAINAYPPASIKASSYPRWLTADVPTHSVKALLVTYDYKQAQTRTALASFGKSLCQNFAALQKGGHPKWRQVSFPLPAPEKAWTYFEPTEQVLRNCSTAPRCALEQKVMGLCSGEYGR